MIELNEIAERLKKPQKKATITKAQDHEARLKLHSETTLSNEDSSRAITLFLNNIKSKLNRSKYNMFLTLLYFPICTVSLVEEIYKYLHKIWDGRNPLYKTDFRSPEHSQDWVDYFHNKLGGMDFWKVKGSNEMKTAINSIMIVDMNSEQTTDRPEPYMYFLPFGNAIDYETTNGSIDWIIFKTSDGKLAVYDDTSYRVYEFLKDSHNEIQSTPIIENLHELNRCPADFFWTTSINTRNPDIKKAPISNQLGQLDLSLEYEIGNDHLNGYARYPIVSSYKVKCKYESEEGDICDSGFLRNADDNYITQGLGLKACPACESRNFVGAGSHLKVTPPTKDNGNIDLLEAVRFTGAPIETLDYNNLDIKNRKDEIFKNVTGFYGNSPNDKAVNEKQIYAMFESLEIALKEPQSNFEKAIKWVTETICILRYGRESFISCSVSLGTEHYILTASQLLDMYQKANETKSFSFAALDQIEDRYFETAYQNNKEQLERQIILTNLDYFRHRSPEEVKALYDNDDIKFEDYFIKINLSSLILRFERENINIVEYGSNSDFNIKIESIYSELISYANEMKPNNVIPLEIIA